MFTLATDTSCDVMRNELDALGIPWVPLTFTIDGETHPDDFTCDAQYKAFYEKVRAGAMPTTSQINTFVQEEFLEKIVAGGANDIVYITLSSGLSATYESGCKAAQEVLARHPDCHIEVVDSRGATQVTHMLLDSAIRLRDSGISGEEAAKILRAEPDKPHVLFMVDDLNHLRRGGRVSGVAAAIGTLLKIKPILTFDKEGKLHVVHKAKGVRRALEYVCDEIAKRAPNVKEVYIAQGDAPEALAEMTAMLKERFGCEVKAGWCGPVIGAHTGAGILGMIFKSELDRPL
ncbi:MAG: DegV family protein, partial [Clostridiales bacterium]|nr:DegV family protein [Clostridiales bacterium]